MRPVFIDSGFPIALISTNDKHHQAALAQNREMNRLLKQKQCRFFTTRAVLLEIGARMAKPAYREAAAQVISAFETSDDVEVIEITSDLFAKGFSLFKSRKDKKWSLCDCISFEAMKARGIQDALAVDSDFEQAGFTILIK